MNLRESILNEKNEIKHFNTKTADVYATVAMMSDMSFQARNLANAAKLFQTMVSEKDNVVILTLAGSLVSAGLKRVIIDLVNNNMVDVIVSTGANIIDQDFFEALGNKHYKGSQFQDDEALRKADIDRIYDTFIDERALKVCDETVKIIADKYVGSTEDIKVLSSRQFIKLMAEYLIENNLGKHSIIKTCYEKNVPIFVPAFSDCSAGFGLVAHQLEKPFNHIAIDSVKDFRELSEIKLRHDDTSLFMIGGGVPKNFVQDTVVMVDIMTDGQAAMHKYAVQITVADERDGALSGSTLKEANSWGKVNSEEGHEQMVFCEATIAFPLIATYVLQSVESRDPKNLDLEIKD